MDIFEFWVMIICIVLISGITALRMYETNHKDLIIIPVVIGIVVPGVLILANTHNHTWEQWTVKSQLNLEAERTKTVTRIKTGDRWITSDKITMYHIPIDSICANVTRGYNVFSTSRDTYKIGKCK